MTIATNRPCAWLGCCPVRQHATVSKASRVVVFEAKKVTPSAGLSVVQRLFFLFLFTVSAKERGACTNMPFSVSACVCAQEVGLHKLPFFLLLFAFLRRKVPALFFFFNVEAGVFLLSPVVLFLFLNCAADKGAVASLRNSVLLNIKLFSYNFSTYNLLRITKTLSGEKTRNTPLYSSRLPAILPIRRSEPFTITTPQSSAPTVSLLS